MQARPIRVAGAPVLAQRDIRRRARLGALCRSAWAGQAWDHLMAAGATGITAGGYRVSTRCAWKGIPVYAPIWALPRHHTSRPDLVSPWIGTVERHPSRYHAPAANACGRHRRLRSGLWRERRCSRRTGCGAAAQLRLCAHPRKNLAIRTCRSRSARWTGPGRGLRAPGHGGRHLGCRDLEAGRRR